ncbi:MAG: LuxR-family transcriptional regulator [Frankiales bacterium]|nr:LuxR-family transcriptional regulator [Frankiales bacterium]
MRDDAAVGSAKTVLVGRAQELDALGSFLAASATAGGTLLLVGQPGLGKTALLEAAVVAATRSGTRTLWTSGAQFEAELSFSGLNQVLLPLLDGLHGLDGLAPAHRAALSVALGLDVGPAANRLVLATAVLALLRQAADGRPLLLVIDDLQWIDRASTAVLAIIARRLASTRVALLAAQRTDDVSFFEPAGIPTLTVGPLSTASAAGLVDERHPGLAPSVRDRVLVDARGVPLALLELPLELSSAQLSAHETLPGTLPLTRHLQTVFATRVAGLPEPTRRLLLLAALDGSGDLRVIRSGAGDESVGADDLAPAEQARLLFVDGPAQKLVFGHPLIRAAVVAAATAGQRRAAHRVLAALFAADLDVHTWHLTEAAVGPDEHVAAQVEAAAYRVLQRGDAVAAVRALTRAAELTPEGPARARRLSGAAYVGASDVGALVSSAALLRQARSADPGQQDSLSAAVVAAFLMVNRDGDLDTAHRLLVAALDAHPAGGSDHVVEEALNTLFMLCFNSGRSGWWGPVQDAVQRLSATLAPTLVLMAVTVADPARVTRAVLEQIDRAVADLPQHPDCVHVQHVFFAATFVDRVDGCRDALLRIIEEDTGGEESVPAFSSMVFVSLAEFATGRWEDAGRHADRGVELADRLGYTMLRWAGWYVQALLAATRGEHAQTGAVLTRMGQWALPRGVLMVKRYIAHVEALAALGRGDYESAFHSCASISPAGVFAAHEPFALWVVLDLVEAAERTGRHEDAVAHVAAAQALGLPDVSSRLALRCAAAAALVAGGEQAAALFEQALAVPGAGSWPFDLARVELLFGEHLRRARATSASRRHLAAALAVFERLGARPWADRARAELQATGQSRQSRDTGDPSTLTPQEREITQLAATGLTNRQIGEQLYLSPRTVSAHLYRVFPKLGVTSRAALRDALSAQAPASATEPSVI